MTVVVGYVPTETGFATVVEAERAARARDVDVVIVNVVGRAGYTRPTAADDRDLEEITAYLTKQGVPNSVRPITSDNRPAEVILDVARDVNASLIMLGLHQRSWLARRVLGSTAQAVVLGAPCPVLIVPDVDQREDRSRSRDVDAPPLESMGQTKDWQQPDQA